MFFWVLNSQGLYTLEGSGAEKEETQSDSGRKWNVKVGDTTVFSFSVLLSLHHHSVFPPSQRYDTVTRWEGSHGLS